MPAGYRCDHSSWFHVPQRAERALRSQGPGLLAACFGCLAKASSKACLFGDTFWHSEWRVCATRAPSAVFRPESYVLRVPTRHEAHRVSEGHAWICMVSFLSGQRPSLNPQPSRSQLRKFCSGPRKSSRKPSTGGPFAAAEREQPRSAFRSFRRGGTSRAVRRRCSWWCKSRAIWCSPASPVSRAPRPCTPLFWGLGGFGRFVEKWPSLAPKERWSRKPCSPWRRTGMG